MKGSTSIRRVVFVHLAPPNIDSGSVVDARNILENLANECKTICSDSVIITNDRKLIEHLIGNRTHTEFSEILYIPVPESPLYSRRLTVETALAMLRNAGKSGVLFLMEEYPNVAVPILFLASLLGSNVMLKYHSYGYLFDKKYLNRVMQTLPSFKHKVLYLVISFIMTLTLRAAARICILTPNNDLADTLNRNLGKRKAIFILPGNFMDTLPLKIRARRGGLPRYDKPRPCTVSSKIDALTVKVANIFSKLQNVNVNIYGKLYGPQGSLIEKMLQKSNLLSYKGVLPTRNHLLELLIENCDRVFYHVGAYDTWAYSLYELLLLFNSVYIISSSIEKVEVMAKLYKMIFDESLCISKENHTAKFYLRKEIDERYISKLNRKYIFSICFLLKKLME